MVRLKSANIYELKSRGELVYRIGDIDLQADHLNEDVTVDAKDLWVLPGFYDLHTHLRFPGQPQKETPDSACQAAIRGGFQAVVAMANTLPPVDDPLLINQLYEAFANLPIDIYQVSCLTKGLRGKELVNIAEMANHGAVAFSDDGKCLASYHLVLEAAFQLAAVRLPILEHAQSDYVAGDGVMNEGIVSRKLGLKGISRWAEVAIVERDIEIAQRTGCHIHLQHLSAQESVELVRQAKGNHIPISCEVNPHHLLLTEESIEKSGTLAKVNPPLRTEKDRLALVEALEDRTIDAVASDHAPHTLYEKNQPLDKAPFGITCIEVSLNILLTLVKRGELSFHRCIESLTTGPLSIIPALRAKPSRVVVVIDPQYEFIFDPNSLVSLGKNSPLAGWKLNGMILGYWSAAVPVYVSESLVERRV
jgi:dihydroorotase